jgi:hypothetical protein
VAYDFSIPAFLASPVLILKAVDRGRRVVKSERTSVSGSISPILQILRVLFLQQFQTSHILVLSFI